MLDAVLVLCAMNSISLHEGLTMAVVLEISFPRLGARSSERLNNLSEVTQRVNTRTWI